MKFRCLHCGLCCSDIIAPVNLTLGDFFRITSFLKIEGTNLFWDYITIVPFSNPDNPLLYDLELGINMPCRFRINQNCSIYKARPLNCRLFPYWILANPKKNGYKRFIDESHKCIRSYEEDIYNKKRYKRYKEIIGKIILEESFITEDILLKRGFKSSIRLEEDFNLRYLDQKQIEIEKIKLYNKLIDKTRYKELPLILVKELKAHSFVDIPKLEDIEKINL